MCSAMIGTQSTLQVLLYFPISIAHSDSRAYHSMQAKCLSELLVSATADDSLNSWFTYLTLAVFVIATIFWLYRMNKALALFDPLFIIPILQVYKLWRTVAVVPHVRLRTGVLDTFCDFKWGHFLP